MSNSILTRFDEVAAVSAATQIVKRLHEAVCSPNGKAYSRQGEARRAQWAELASIAVTQRSALEAEAVVKKRAVKREKAAPTVATTSAPITVMEIGEKAQ